MKIMKTNLTDLKAYCLNQKQIFLWDETKSRKKGVKSKHHSQQDSASCKLPQQEAATFEKLSLLHEHLNEFQTMLLTKK